MPFAPAITRGLRDALTPDPDAWIAAHAATAYDVRPVSSRFADARALREALDAGDTVALGCVVAMASAAHPTARASSLARAVLDDTSLHRDELLVLVCLRHLVTDPAPEALRAALPLLVRRWLTAETGLDRCPCPQRAALLGEFLDEAEPFMDAAAHAWPEADGSDATWPVGGDEFPVVGALVVDVWRDATPDERARLHAFVTRYHARAATQRARLDAARTLLRLGDASAAHALTRSAIPLLRAYGLSALLDHAPFATLAREAARLFTPGPRRDELLAALMRHSHVAACPCRDGVHVAVAVTGRPDAPYADVAPRRTRVGWLHAPTSTWAHTWELDLALYQGASLTQPKGDGVAALLQGHSPAGPTRRYVFLDASGAPAWAATAKEMSALRRRPR